MFRRVSSGFLFQGWFPDEKRGVALRINGRIVSSQILIIAGVMNMVASWKIETNLAPVEAIITGGMVIYIQ
ncbi:MAG: hypothetical protein FGF52_06105 [Candidatus Brockarchaeota archaeon]|nr:hypothetical protein [Candidatus Brockarchaeota archaeon]